MMRLIHMRYFANDNTDAGPAPAALRDAAMLLVGVVTGMPRVAEPTLAFDGPPCAGFDAPAVAVIPAFQPKLVIADRPGLSTGSWSWECGLDTRHSLALTLEPKPGRDPWDWRKEMAAGDFDVAVTRWHNDTPDDPFEIGTGPEPATPEEVALVLAAAAQLEQVRAVNTEPQDADGASRRKRGRRPGRRGRREQQVKRRAEARSRRAISQARRLLTTRVRWVCEAERTLALEMLEVFERRGGQTGASGAALAAACGWLATAGTFLSHVAEEMGTPLETAMEAHADLHGACWLPDEDDPLSRRVAQCLRDQQERSSALPPWMQH